MSTKVSAKEFYRLQRKWYGKLAREGFFDIEGGMDLQCTKLMTNPGASSTMMSMNALHQRTGRPMLQESNSPGSEWEETVSEQDGGAARREPSGVYMHYAQLIASQEYELCRLGMDRRASRTRLAWALHSQGTSERTIADICETTRHEIRCHIEQLDAMVHLAIDLADAA